MFVCAFVSGLRSLSVANLAIGRSPITGRYRDTLGATLFVGCKIFFSQGRFASDGELSLSFDFVGVPFL